MNAQHFYDDFRTKGYHLVYDMDCFDFLNEIKTCEWKDWSDQLRIIKRTPEIEEALQNTQILIAEKYIEQLDPSYSMGSYDVFDGIDIPSNYWHNDLKEGHNLSVLLYIDTVNETTGGEVEFQDIETNRVSNFYPQEGNVAFFNHGLRFVHRVSPLVENVWRRVVTFHFNVNPVLTS